MNSDLTWLKKQPSSIVNRRSLVFLAASMFALSACENQAPQIELSKLCGPAWYQSVESAINTGDGMGHGPDIGSDEWRSVIEFKLGVRGNAEVPDRNSEEWCRYIDGFIKGN